MDQFKESHPSPPPPPYRNSWHIMKYVINFFNLLKISWGSTPSSKFRGVATPPPPPTLAPLVHECNVLAYIYIFLVQVTDPSNPKSKFNIVNVYRPPRVSTSHLTDFIDYFTLKLFTLNTSKTTFACGDFNINLLSLNNNEHHNAYLEGILSSGFLPTITLPTRLSNNSTLIDNIFVNKQEKLNFAGILNNEISDHQAIVNDLNVVLPPQRTVYVTINILYQ